MIKRYKFIFAIFFLIQIINPFEANAQCTPCGSPTTVSVNLSANPDTTYSMTSTRNGLCCGASGTNCIRFDVTINPGANEVSFNVANPAPPGGAFYQVNCGPPTSLGTPLCVTGMTSFCIVFCKSGGDSPTYTISSARTFEASPDITLNSNCTGPISIAGLQEPTITWNSVFPGAVGAYNSYLSCTSACDTTYVTPQVGYPSYIDFAACGTATGCSSGTSCDTVRVNIVAGLTVDVTPTNATICAGNPITLTANITGGNSPYSYLWSTSEATPSIVVSSPGTYTVFVSDSTNCPAVSDTVVVGAAPAPNAPTASGTTICTGTTAILTATAPGGTYEWYDAAIGGTLLFTGASYTTPVLVANTTYYVETTVSGCTSLRTAVTVTVTPNNTASAPSSTPTVCINTVITNITHTTTGATGIGAAVGLPAGVTASWAGNTITISGTSTASGTFNYTIPLTGGCGAVNATGTITVTPANTASAPLSTPTVCINTAITNITHTTTGATGIGAAVGLPAGVTASWAGNTITISGTPTASGTFNYTIPLTGGCGAVNATGTITVTPANIASAPSSTPTVCINTAITNITHTTTGATGIGAPAGLPAGVTANWVGGVITISGTPTVLGTFNYTIPLTGGCGAVNATGTIIVTTPNTASAPSSTPTVCINTAITNITHTTTGATGIGAAAGLPAGVTANWAANTITISGTPTASGTFNYTIPLTGGCGAVNATGTITVTPTNTVSAASSTPTVCINTAITAITHTTTGATGIGAAVGLPAGVTANWAGGVITISGTPTASGTFNYTIPLTGGCGAINATGTITVTPTNTVSAASSTPTVCINTAITNITHTTTGATGIGAAVGLPAGVTANWAANTITISGTPTVAGTFNYTIPLTGGCGTVNATGTITVTTNNTVSAASSSPTVCINTAMTSITHTTTGATGIGVAVGLPAGVTANWAANTITISGTPSVAGTFNYTIPLTGGCGTINATGTITVTPANTVSAPSSTPTVCINTAITNITHTTIGATGIGAAVGLPAGVTANWAANTITISGTPSVAGTFNYTIPLTGGCGTINATGTITVTPNNTVSVASSTPTVCINTAITNITHTTTGANGIGAAVGLPAGVTANWAANTITISGTPTVAGTFNYTIPLLGGCGAVNATGTITVTPNNTVSVASSTPTVCINTAITNITHTTTGATGIGAASGLPAGVTANWAANTITISGTPTVTGTFNYTIPLTGGCGAVNATGTITVNPIPVAPTASGTTICSGNSTTITATAPGGTYRWYSAPSGGTLLFTGASYTTPILATTTTYYVQTTVGGCISPRTAVTVTVNPTPAAPTANGTTICEGNTATVTATAPGGTYEWYDIASGGTLLFTGASYTTPVLSTTDTFYVQSTISSCTGLRTMVVVTVTPTDDPSFNYSSGTYCITGTNPTPTITGGFGGTFTATPAGLTINSSTGTITLSSSALNTYVVTFTTNGPCPDNSSVNITITNAPDATFSYNTPICQSGANELPSFPIGSSGGIFSAPAGLVFVNTSTGEIDVQSSLPGNYTITNFIAAAGGCSQATATFNITIDQAATVDAGTYSDICSGTLLSLSGIIGGSASSATWSGGAGTYAPDANTLNATYTPSAGEQTAGMVTLILTTNDPAGFCSAVADTVSINIIPLPVAPTASGTTICEGDSTTLTASAPGGIYQWYNALSGGTLLATGASYSTGILTSTTTYFVQTTVNGCAGSRTPVTVNVTPLPAAPTASGTTICSGSTATITATAPGGAYEWFDIAVSGTLLDTGVSYTTPVLTATDTFYVQTTVSGCTGLRTPVIVTVNPIPTAPIVGNPTICNGSSATLTATAPGGTYEWYDAASGGTLLFTGASYTTPILVATTTYFVQTTVGGCTSARTIVTVTVNPIPAAPTANGTTICEGNTATLTATAPGATYRWYNTPSGGTLLATGANYTTPILSTTTTYYVQTTSGGCTSPRTAVTVTVILNDDPTFAYSSGTYCITGTNPTPVISGTIGGAFTSTPVGLIINSSTGQIDLSTSALGTYTVTYTTNGTCPLSSSVSVTITTAPDATFSFSDPYCQLTVNPFPTFPSGSSAGVFSAIPAGLNFVNTGTGEINLSTSAAGTYTVTNFIVAAGGCDSSTYSTTIVIEEAATVNAGSNQTICVGATVTLNGSFGGIATSATWSGGAGIFNPDNSTMNAVYTPTAGEYAAGIVNIILTTNDPGGVCTAASDILTILFNEDDPSFSYSSGTYCVTGTNPVANITGGSTGTFSATPVGLVFVNASTGEINLGASTLGTYNVTFTTDGTCPASSSMSITITNGFDATFSYNTPVCQSSGNEIPVFPLGASAGVFSAIPAGLVFVNTSTGEIDLAASTPNTYTITNFIATSGGCAFATYSSSFTIDMSAQVDAGLDLTACVGDNVTLSGSIGGSASSATWSGGLGTFSPNNTDLNATYTPDSSETLVSLILTTDDPSGSCTAIADTVTITINPLPAAPTASDDTICEGTSTTLTATAPGGSYQWFSNPTGGSSLFNGAVFNTPVLTTTTIYYLQTTVSGCSSDTRTPVTVTINPTDDPSFNYSPSTYCVSGGNATPTITGGATGTFTATPSGLIFADSSTGEIDVATTTLGTYTITFTTNGQCPDSATFDVTITNAPDATFSYNNPYCASGSNPFPTFAVGASAGVFTALPAGLVFVNANTGQVNLSASTPGIYTVTNDIAAGGGCVQAIYSDTIEILPAPTVDAGVDTSICANNTQIDLSGMVTNAGGMVWSTSGDGTFAPDTTSANVTYNAGTNDITNGSTTIYLTTTQNGVCSAVMDSIIITITPAPIVDAGNNILICDGTLSTILNGSVSGGASSGMWTSMGTGTFSPDNTTLNASYTLSLLDSANGGVQLVLESTNNGGCLVVYDTLDIFLSSPATTFAGIDTTVCVNNSLVQLGGTITGGTSEGIWSSLGGGTFTPTANDLNASYQLDSTDIANGFVTLILDAVNSCVPASDTIVITVNPAPVADAGNNITICEAESAPLNGSISFADGGQWTSNGTGTFMPNDTTLNATYVPSSADITLGTLELVLTSSGNGTCNAVSDTLMLSFSESPVASFSTIGSCEGTVVQFNDSSTITTGSITDYAWDFGNGDTSSVQNPTSIYTAAGSYTVTLIITSNSGCNDTVSNVITINPLPTAAFSYLSTCTTDTVLFTDNSTVASGSVTQWDWDFGDLTTSTLQNPSHGFGIIDTFSVTLTVTSDSGCTANITQDVIVAPQPIVDFGYAINCQNSTVTYTDSSSAAAGDVIVAYLWTFGNGNTSILQNPLPETYASGSYLVQLQITTQSGCTAIDTATINIAAIPTAAYIPQGGQFNLNEVINFTNQSQNAVSYHWNFGNNNDTSNVENPSYGYATNGTYTVTLISNAGGCADTISYDFEIIGTPVRPVVVPTAFSPNSDGINDVFSILGGPFKTYQLTVYNEWGQEIFTSNEQIDGWDGSYKGNNQPTGSYVYVFNGITIVDEIIKLHGEIAIVK